MNSSRQPDPPLTNFQRRVYDALLKIPRGKVTTYKILARYIFATDSLPQLSQGSACGGNCRSCLAVGQALRRNPLAPKVPCHRVIASDLTPGGFQGKRTGAPIKRKLKLLAKEGVEFRDGRLANPDMIYRFNQINRTIPPFNGQQSDYHGFKRYDSAINNCPVIVVEPKHAVNDYPWMWRAAYFDHRPEVDLALLMKGFFLVFIDTGDSYACPDAMAHWDALYRQLTTKHGFSPKPALEGLSIGGLFVYTWAINHPDRVGCIYADNPVCDFKSCPGGKGRGPGLPSRWEKLIQCYHFRSEAEALAYKKNPIDNLKPLADARIPLLHVSGDADEVVSYEDNTVTLKQRYEQFGGKIEVIVKKGGLHHPHGLDDPAPIINFILAHTITPRPRRGDLRRPLSGPEAHCARSG